MSDNLRARIRHNNCVTSVEEDIALDEKRYWTADF